MLFHFHNTVRSFFTLLLLAAAACAMAQPRVLVFSKTAGYRHASIVEGKSAFLTMAAQNGFIADTTENPTVFNDKNLMRYAAVVFLSTTGDVLTPVQQIAFERYIQAGGGYLGIHAATDTEYDWPWYGKLAGGYFKDHPSTPSNVQKGTYHIHDNTHASTKFLPEPWARSDEFYSFKSMNPDVKVLVTIDEKTYIGGTMGDWHPAAWYHEYDGGRAFYTAMGHTAETYAEPLFLRHVLEGLRWVMNEKLDYTKAHSALAPEENRFTKVVLKEKLNEPMELTVFKNGQVLFVERHGDVKLYDPQAGDVRTIATIPVSTKYKNKAGEESEAEDGILGLTQDPNYEQNHWIYIYYSAAGDIAKNVVGRFVYNNGKLDLDSKKIILEVPVQREECCHAAGSMAWDAQGNLYISTGDNSSPRADGYAPIDEREGRGPWDAQKSSGNTNDLRGKIIRIHPQADGSYTIPEGNLFPKGTPKTRPEIYTMGHRNPFRIAIDKKTGFVYWGDVGPDAGKPDSLRGPESYDEVGQARKAGNFGWPYFVGDNKAYREYDYATKISGPYYDPNKPVNVSPNNTGLNELPAAQKAFIWYPYDESKEFPLMGTGGRNAMAGPVYHREDFKNTERPFPDYYDGKLLIYEWMRGWIMAVTMDKQGNYVSMERFMPSYKFSNPMDMEFGPNGDLYVLEYGTGWFQGNDDARLIRIEYNAGNRKPVVEISADRKAGALPLAVQLTSAGTKDFDGDALTYQWALFLQKDGKQKPVKKGLVAAASGSEAKVMLDKKGVYTAVLTVTDSHGATNSRSIELVAGNEPPVLDFDLGSSNRSFFFPNQKIKYATRVTDREDGSIVVGTISPDAVAVTANYLAEGYDQQEIARGHRDAEESAAPYFARALKLMGDSDCKSCHFADRKSVGPEYRLVAQKYRDQPDAAAHLGAKIISGGGGVWGDVAMAAHPAISKKDAEEMASYILSLGSVTPRMPAEGEFETSVPADDPGLGVYLLWAAYKDRGAVGLPAQSSEIVYVLHNSKMSPHGADSYEKVQKMEFGGMKLAIPGGSGAFMRFNQIDLTGITRVDFMFSCPKRFNAAGGYLEIRIDDPKGRLIGKTEFIEPTDKEGAEGMLVPKAALEQVAGLHDLYFVFVNEKDPTAQMLFVLISAQFQTAESIRAAAAAPPAANNVIEDYVGTYKMTGLPFETVSVWIENGKLIGQGGEDKGPLTPLSTPDMYDASGQAIVQFLRDAAGKVTGVRLRAQGSEFEGKKQ